MPVGRLSGVLGGHRFGPTTGLSSSLSFVPRRLKGKRRSGAPQTVTGGGPLCVTCDLAYHQFETRLKSALEASRVRATVQEGGLFMARHWTAARFSLIKPGHSLGQQSAGSRVVCNERAPFLFKGQWRRITDSLGPGTRRFQLDLLLAARQPGRPRLKFMFISSFRLASVWRPFVGRTCLALVMRPNRSQHQLGAGLPTCGPSWGRACVQSGRLARRRCQIRPLNSYGPPGWRTLAALAELSIGPR